MEIFFKQFGQLWPLRLFTLSGLHRKANEPAVFSFPGGNKIEIIGLAYMLSNSSDPPVFIFSV